MQLQPIGIFDSGFGGLTVLKSIVQQLREYDFIYLGDNARAPYGTRSFDTVHRYTLEAVEWFLRMNCPLVILACNTASAKALRTIQQKDLPESEFSNRKVLGVIRPTTELIGRFSKTGSVGVLATPGTVQSESYPIEIARFFPDLKVYQEACPIWVPLIENGEMENAGADFFIKKHLRALFEKSPDIDTVLLGCTHYPLMMEGIRRHLPDHVQILAQGEIVASSLKDYLSRHPEIDDLCTRNGERYFYTTDSITEFDKKAALFYGTAISSKKAILG